MGVTVQLFQGDMRQAFLLNNKKPFLLTLPSLLLLVFISLLIGYFILLFALGLSKDLFPLLLLALIPLSYLVTNLCFSPEPPLHTTGPLPICSPPLRSPSRKRVQNSSRIPAAHPRIGTSCVITSALHLRISFPW